LKQAFVLGGQGGSGIGDDECPTQFGGKASHQLIEVQQPQQFTFVGGTIASILDPLLARRCRDTEKRETPRREKHREERNTEKRETPRENQ